MLSIQEVGLSILGDNPKNFYILGGSEYGVKDRYIEALTAKIGPKVEFDTVLDVINFLSKFHIIPLKPSVYVVRYDKSFVTADSIKISRFKSLNILGTLVLVYEDAKDLAKLDKLFPENTASIDPIGIKMMNKYLKSDYPDLDKRTIEYVAKNASNYYHAKNMCRCLACIKDKVLLSEKQIISLFNIQTTYTNNDIQVAIASRDFNALIRIVDRYDGDMQSVLYQILRVMVELDKCQNGRYVNSPLKKYASAWTRADIYWMFSHTYNAIKDLRSGAVADVKDIITYLGALLVFKTIPDVRMLR